MDYLLFGRIVCIVHDSVPFWWFNGEQGGACKIGACNRWFVLLWLHNFMFIFHDVSVAVATGEKGGDVTALTEQHAQIST